LDHELIIDYEVSTDQRTIKNITNHAYFNLSGNVKKDILDHEIMLNAEKFTPIDKEFIPTGEIRSVENTPFDFRKPKKIGKDINNGNEQLEFGLGYDHNYILSDSRNGTKFVGTVFDPESGRLMEIHTTEPAVQFYSGNFMDGSHAGHLGKVYQYREAICFETQHYPDSPNHPNFPSTELNPGEVYESSTIYKFLIK
jgi:aldose 1-epimerase